MRLIDADALMEKIKEPCKTKVDLQCSNCGKREEVENTRDRFSESRIGESEMNTRGMLSRSIWDETLR